MAFVCHSIWVLRSNLLVASVSPVLGIAHRRQTSQLYVRISGCFSFGVSVRREPRVVVLRCLHRGRGQEGWGGAEAACGIAVSLAAQYCSPPELICWSCSKH